MWRLLLLLPLLAACGDGEMTGSDPQLPSTYSFDLESSCGERSLIGEYRVWVEDGEVTGVRPRADVEIVPSLADLEALVADAEPDAVVETERAPEGWLTWVSIDHLPDALDDEECYRVTNVE